MNTDQMKSTPNKSISWTTPIGQTAAADKDRDAFHRSTNLYQMDKRLDYVRFCSSLTEFIPIHWLAVTRLVWKEPNPNNMAPAHYPYPNG